MAELVNVESPDITKIKFWIHRLKFDGWLKYLYFFNLIIGNAAAYYNYGLDYYLERGTLYKSVIWSVLWLIILFYAKRLPSIFQRLISSNRNIFAGQEDYNKYMGFAHKRFSHSIEKWLGLILGLGWGVSYFSMTGIAKMFQTISIHDVDVAISGVRSLTYGIQLFFFSFNYCLGGIMAFSLVFLYFQFFYLINKLGTEQFPLYVTYTSIRAGSFHDIGRAIISVAVPLLLVSTLVGVFGLGNIYLFADVNSKNIFYGFMETIIGMVIAAFVAFLLYKDTIHVHRSIVAFKGELVEKTIADLETEMSQEKIDYDRILSTSEFIKEIESTGDWPFDPASIKKLAITFGTTVLPFILSFFGLEDDPTIGFIMGFFG